MAKKDRIELDDLNLKKGTIGKDEVVQIRDAKFGKTSKLPSLLARGMADQMFKNPDTGAFVSTDGLDSEKKKAVVNALKKDFSRIAKSTNRTTLKIRAVDQGNRLVFFYDVKKSKEEKKVASGKK
jgi:hypothetical protein